MDATWAWGTVRMRVWVTAWRVSYRRLRVALGRVGALAVLGAIPLAATGLWVYLWAPLRGFFEPLRDDPAMVATISTSLLASFLMVAVVVRVGVLAFDVIGRELRLLLGLAPLGRLRRAIVAVVPEFAVGAAISVGFGGTALVVFASMVRDFPVVEALLWMVAIVVWVGAVSALVEEVGVRLTASMFTSRAVASVVLLGTALALVFRLAEILVQGRLLPSWMAGLPALPTPAALVLGGMTIGSGLVVWLAAASLTSRSVLEVGLGPRRRRPLNVSSASIAVAVDGVRALLREPANRAAALAFAVLLVALVQFAGLIGLGLTLQLVVWAAVVGSGVVVLSNFGGFLEIRWIVAVSPFDESAALRRWSWARSAAGMLVVVVIAAWALWLFGDPAPGVSPSPASIAAGWMVVTGAAAVAGRLVPYRKSDLMTMAATAALASVASLAVGGATAWLIERLGPLPGLAVAGAWTVWAWSMGSRSATAA